jgi:hypothetical protein
MAEGERETVRKNGRKGGAERDKKDRSIRRTAYGSLQPQARVSASDLLPRET